MFDAGDIEYSEYIANEWREKANQRLEMLKRCDYWIRELMDDPPHGLIEFLDELAAELEKE